MKVLRRMKSQRGCLAYGSVVDAAYTGAYSLCGLSVYSGYLCYVQGAPKRKEAQRKVQEQQQRPARAMTLFEKRLPGQFTTDFQRIECPAVDVRALE